MSTRIVEGRRAIAAELSRIMGGARVDEKHVDRLSTRTRDPLPVHGYDRRAFALVDELEAWWRRNDRAQTGETGQSGTKVHKGDLPRTLIRNT